MQLGAGADAARTVRHGGAVMGTSPAPHVKLQSFEGIVPKVTNWRTLGLNDEELALSSLVPTKARAPA